MGWKEEETLLKKLKENVKLFAPWMWNPPPVFIDLGVNYSITDVRLIVAYIGFPSVIDSLRGVNVLRSMFTLFFFYPDTKGRIGFGRLIYWSRTLKPEFEYQGGGIRVAQRLWKWRNEGESLVVVASMVLELGKINFERSITLRSCRNSIYTHLPRLSSVNIHHRLERERRTWLCLAISELISTNFIDSTANSRILITSHIHRGSSISRPICLIDKVRLKLLFFFSTFLLGYVKNLSYNCCIKWYEVR